jgi:hypothetical protein
MRILKGLSSKLLGCGCIAGVYETYDGEVVTIIDAQGSSCASQHTAGQVVPAAETDFQPAPVRRTSSDKR